MTPYMFGRYVVTHVYDSGFRENRTLILPSPLTITAMEQVSFVSKQAMRATSAALTFFHPVQIEYDNGKKRGLFSDGAIG